MSQIHSGLVVSKQKLNDRYCLLGIQSPDLANEARSGQFVNVEVPSGGHDPLLKRPFGIHKVDHNEGIIYILFKIVGTGTEILSSLEPGVNLEVIGPLGNGFTLTEKQSVLLVGGGIGIAPLYELAVKLSELGNKVKLVLGLTDEKDLILGDIVKDFDSELIMVHGDKTGVRNGLVTELVEEAFINEEFDQIYVCGPNAMMAALKKMLGDKNKIAQFSLEERMGCGVGLCFSCTCKVKDEDATDGWKNERVCTCGPVFMADEVIFDD
ncbi:MAG: dihydroorotate dehydrogenase electron transfer subunit [Halanaerobiales bacterium]|nr:dihydroorotate dehydrogenase electron transfer subunit [Halanaerobiales bacterium]